MEIITYRTEKLNYNEVYNNIINGIRKYCETNNINNVVLGISGGIDSTVAAALIKASGIKLTGVSLPCSTNSNDEKSIARLVGKEFCDNFREINMQPTFEAVEGLCTNVSEKESTPISQGNIKARLRMITLYDIASKEGGLVIDTDNLTEHFLGFFTIHGDVADLNPIGGLWKHEVYDLARYLCDNIFKGSESLNSAIAITPTDGNGVKEGGDLAQIAPGKTYDDVDEILMSWVGLDPRVKNDVLKSDFNYGIFNKLCDKHGKDIVSMVINRSVKSEFKCKQAPFVIDIYRGLICEKNGKILS